jgi:hypothetical protein
LNLLLKALDEKDGVTAANLVDKNTLQFYQHITDLANTGTKQAILAEPTLVGGTAVVMRAIFVEHNLKSTTGYNTFKYGAMYRSNPVPSPELIKFDHAKLLTPDTADIYVEVGGSITNGTYTATKENGVWKINLMPTMKQATDAIEAQGATQDNNFKENFILTMAIALGIDMDKIWVPLQ